MKKRSDFSRIRLKNSEMRANSLFQFIFGACRCFLTNCALQIAVYKFIRVILRSIWRQIENLNTIFMLFKPFLNLFRVMNPQIIENQKYFFVGITNQPIHKIDKLSGIHIFFVKHKTQFPAL